MDSRARRPYPPLPLTVVVGDEEFLVSRALEDLRHAALAADPDDRGHELEGAANRGGRAACSC